MHPGGMEREGSLNHSLLSRAAAIVGRFAVSGILMRAKPFDASQFVATRWNSAADKGSFGNTYLHFIESEWKRSLFTKSFYQRLSNCFGHIAHNDIHGFYDTWFTRDRHRLGFLKNTLSWPCWGDPTFTYSDVESTIKKQVRARNYVALYEVKAAEELRSAEMAILTRLEAKYRLPVDHSTEVIAKVSIEAQPPDARPLSTPVIPIQGSLF
jgi:hypothetical protein